MVADCCSKFILTTINGVFMLLGLAVGILGLLFKLDWDVVRDAFNDESQKVDVNLQSAGDTLGSACIGLGIAMFVLAFVGFCGAKYRVKLLLVVYAVVVLALLIAQVVVVALVAAHASDAETSVQKGLRDALKGYDEEMSDPKSKAWSALFSTLECCGVSNRTYDFASGFNMSSSRTDEQKLDRNPIPIACCKNFDYEESKITSALFKNDKINKCLIMKSAEYAYTEGCETKISDFISGHRHVMLGVGAGVFGVEVIVVVIAFFLTCCDGSDDYKS